MGPTSSTAARLAVDGGAPVRTQPLPYGQHAVSEDDIAAVAEVLRSSRLTTGPAVDAFEQAFAEQAGARFAVALSSGTAALHAAVFAAGLGPGDEGVTTPLTFCATANSLLYQGARPVFADVSPDTLNLDPEAAARLITPRTKAILPVDYAGHPADLGALLDLAEARGLVVIEDATHAPGARYRNRPVGSISHMSVFSFHPVKHLTTGEGGIVTTDDAGYARRLRQFRHHGIDQDAPRAEPWRYEMTALGYNYRLSDIACALGRSQLRRLEAGLARRAAIAARYTGAFGGLAAIEPPAVRGGVRHAWHLYPVRLALDRLRAGRSEILRALTAEGLGAAVHFLPVYQHPYYRALMPDAQGSCPVAEDASARLISLPLFPAMTDHDVSDVIEAVGKVLTHYAR